MFALCRNLRMLRNPAAQSLAAFRSRFLSYTIVNIILGGIYAYQANSMAKIDDVDHTIPDIIKYLPLVVGAMFLLDAVLMFCLWRMSKNEGGLSAKMMAVKVNVVANSITMFTYLYCKVITLQWIASHDVDYGSFAYALIILIAISKITGIMVICAFRNWLRTHEAAESATAYLYPAAVPALTPQVAQPAQAAPHLHCAPMPSMTQLPQATAVITTSTVPAPTAPQCQQNAPTVPQ